VGQRGAVIKEQGGEGERGRGGGTQLGQPNAEQNNRNAAAACCELPFPRTVHRQVGPTVSTQEPKGDSPTSTQGLRFRLCGMISLGGAWCSMLAAAPGNHELRSNQTRRLQGQGNSTRVV